MLNIGEYSISLHFAGSKLVPKVIPAFEHLFSRNESGRHLKIYLFDSKSTKVNFPSPPWEIPANLINGEQWVCDTDRIKLIHQPFQKKLMILNMETDEAIFWVDDPEQIPYYESSAPLRTLLHWWMSKMGSQLLHAGAVGIPGKGVILVGKGGSGKSHTALACLDSKVSYASDDYCLLSFNPKPVIHSLFSTGKMFFDDIEHLPFIRPALYNGKDGEMNDEKALFFLFEKFQNKILKEFPINAIFIVTVTNRGNPQLIPASPAKAFTALAPSTIMQIHGYKRETHNNISSLVKQVPSYILELGDDIKKVPDLFFFFFFFFFFFPFYFSK